MAHLRRGKILVGTIVFVIATAASCSSQKPAERVQVASGDQAISLVRKLQNPKTGMTFEAFAREEFAKSSGCPDLALETHSFDFIARQPKDPRLPWVIGFVYKGSPDPRCIDVALNTMRYVAIVNSITGAISVPQRGREFPTAEAWPREFLTDSA